jgi:myo-inositol-1-phosphate synthase
MTISKNSHHTPSLLIMVAGAKGAIGSTIAAAIPGLKHTGGLTTADKFSFLGPLDRIQMVGWDTDKRTVNEAISFHQVLPDSIREQYTDKLSQLDILPAPGTGLSIGEQVEILRKEIKAFQSHFPGANAVLVNLLPACAQIDQTSDMHSMDAIVKRATPGPPDIAYTIAAVLSGIPVVNFTPNTVELPAICEEARKQGLPIIGRDGKTGQTYFKVVLASAFKARGLTVDGWYSLNILGNEDGRNLMDPERAREKLKNKTTLLDDVLGYRVGEQYGRSTHKVHIDYYPPRGDAKEAWDVVDFSGLFGLPMSLRLNLQGRDSILAAPMVIDLARWAAALKHVGIGGPVAELGFFFKKPVGPNPPVTFQEQLAALDHLEHSIIDKLDAVK